MDLFSTRRRRTAPAPAAARTGLAGRDFRLLLVATLGAFASYAPLLSVVPLWAADGGSGHGGVGATTGVTMGTTVAVQLCMGLLMRRFHLRGLLTVGAVLLGLPAFAYAVSSSLGWVLGVSAVRGVGFGMVVVAGSALVAELVPAAQRGRAVGWYGVAVGLPQVLLLPAGVWCAETFGFTAVFVAAGVLGVLAPPLVLGMSGRRTAVDADDHGTGVAEDPEPTYRPLAGLWALLLTAACALGVAMTFLPLALASPGAAPLALFVLSAAVIAGRWLAGLRGDRRGAGGLLVPSVIACAVGMGGLALATGTGTTPATVTAAVAAAVYGLGFGALQNDTLVLMFHRAGRRGHGTASTVWNLAFDGGTGTGALSIGLLALVLDLPAAFAVSALVIALAVPLAWSESRRARSASGRTSGASPARLRSPHGGDRQSARRGRRDTERQSALRNGRGAG